jgi:hypothetical protein
MGVPDLNTKKDHEGAVPADEDGFREHFGDETATITLYD